MKGKQKFLMIMDVIVALIILCNVMFPGSVMKIFSGINQTSDKAVIDNNASFKFIADPEEKYVKAGETVQIRLSAEDIKNCKFGINSIVGWLEYDESVFDSVSFEGVSNSNGKSEELADWNVELNKIKDHKLYGKFCIYTRNEGVTDDQCVAVMTVKLKDDLKPMTTEIKFNNLESSDGDIALKEQNRIVRLIIVEDEIPAKPEQKPSQSIKTGDSTIAIYTVIIAIAVIINILILVKNKKLKICLAVVTLVVGLLIASVSTFAVEKDGETVASKVNTTSTKLLDSDEYLVTDTDISRIAPRTSIKAIRNSMNKSIAIYRNEDDYKKEHKNDESAEVNSEKGISAEEADTKTGEETLEKSEDENTESTRLIDSEILAATGMVVKADDEDSIYKISVVGDMDGDGDSNQVELTKIIRNVLDSEKWALVDVYAKSADMKLDGSIDDKDIIASVRWIVYEELEIPPFEKVKAPELEVIKGTYDEEIGAYFDDVTVQVNQNDPNAKVTMFRVDNEPWIEVEPGHTVTITQDGTYTFSTYSYGVDGNRSEITVLTLTKMSPKYIVRYHYEGKDSVDSDPIVAKLNDKITEYEDKNIDGYVLEKVEPKELIVTTKEENNILNVYYIKGSFDYEIHYFYDGNEIPANKPTTGLSAVFGTTISEEDIKEYIAANKIDGYKKSEVKTADSNDKLGEMPLKITSNPSNNKIYVYYVKDSFKYTIHYLYDDEERSTHPATEKNATFGSLISKDDIQDYIDANNNVDGYEYTSVATANGDGVTGTMPLRITSNGNDNNIYVYYNKAKFKYSIHYYYNGTEDTSKTKNDLEETFGEIITKDFILNNYREDVEGYVLEEVLPEELTITSDETKNIIKVKYIYDILQSKVVIHHVGVSAKGTEFSASDDEELVLENATIASIPTSTFTTTTLLSSDNKLKINGTAVNRTRETVNTDIYSFNRAECTDKNATISENGEITGHFKEGVQEVTYYYDAKGYNITGEVIGGNGQFKEEITENVIHGGNSTKDIILVPNNGYCIDKIMLYEGEAIDGTYLDEDDNGVEITDYELDEDKGIVTIEKFTNVTTDKHIVATFKEREFVAQIVAIPDGSDVIKSAVDGEDILMHKYYTLEAAIADAALIHGGNSSGTNYEGTVEIKILKDINGEHAEIINKNDVTIDLDSHTISGNFDNKKQDDGLFFIDDAYLTVIDKSDEQTGKITNTNKNGIGIYITMDGSCTLGTNEKKISIVSPTIEAGSVGIFKEADETMEQLYDEERDNYYYPQGILNFYDGKVIGAIAIMGHVEDTPLLYNATVSKDESQNQVSILAIANNIEARIGRKRYTLLEDAIADANTVIGTDGSQVEITVVKDLSKAAAVVVDSSKNILLDIEGHTITTHANDYVFKNYGKLEIYDSTVDEKNPYGKGSIVGTTNGTILNGLTKDGENNDICSTEKVYTAEDFVSGDTYGYEGFATNEDGTMTFKTDREDSSKNYVSGYVHIDLKNKQGMYKVQLTIDSTNNKYCYGYANITRSCQMPLENNQNNRFMSFSYKNTTDESFTSPWLIGGEEYYLYISTYMEGNSTSKVDVKSVKLLKSEPAELVIDTCTISNKVSNEGAIVNYGKAIISKETVEGHASVPRLVSTTGNYVIYNYGEMIVNDLYVDSYRAIKNFADLKVNYANVPRYYNSDSPSINSSKDSKSPAVGIKTVINDGFYAGPITTYSTADLTHIINGGTYNNFVSPCSYAINQYAEINGGTFNGNVTFTAEANTKGVINGGTFNATVYCNESSSATKELEINGGTFNGQVNTYYKGTTINDGNFYGQIRNIKDGTLNINGGTFTPNNTNPIYNEGVGTVNIVGGEFTSSYPVYNHSTGTITLGKNDGTISTTKPKITSTANGLVNLRGIFNFYDGIIIAPEQRTIIGMVSDVPEGAEVLINYNQENLEEATVGIPTEPVAKIGTKTYTTLSAAFAAVPEGTATATKIELLKSVYVIRGIEIPENKNVILDMGNNRIYDIVDGILFTNNGKFEITSDTVSEKKSINLSSKTNNGDYGFDLVDGKLVSNNSDTARTTADCYFEIDLTDKKGLYKLNINYNIDYDNGGDRGYAVLTESADTPNYSSVANKIIDTYGNSTGNVAMYKFLAGKKYYLHFGYYNNAKNSSSTASDTFSVNSISIKSIESRIVNNGVKTFFENTGTMTVKNIVIDHRESENGSSNVNNIFINSGNLTIDNIENAEFNDKNGYCYFIQNNGDGNVTVKNSYIRMNYGSSCERFINSNSTGTITLDNNTIYADTLIYNNGAADIVINSGYYVTYVKGIENYSSGTITMNNGTLYGSYSYESIYLRDGSALIKNGKIQSSYSYTTIRLDGNSAKLVIENVTMRGGISNEAAESEVTIHNGKFSTSGTNISNKGILTVNNGEFVSTGNSNCACLYNYNKAYINNGTYTSSCNNRGTIYNEAEVVIKDGIIKNTSYAGIQSTNKVTLGEKGDGNVSKEKPSIYGKQYGIVSGSSTLNFYDGIAEGSANNSISGTISDVEDGYEIIKEDDIENSRQKAYPDKLYIAKVVSTGKSYYTIGEAFNACANNTEETVEILREALISSSISSAEVAENKNIVLDLKGYFVSAGNDKTITVKGKLKIKDSSENSTGLFRNTTGKLITLEESGNLIVESGKLQNTTPATLIENNGTGTVTISGGILDGYNTGASSNTYHNVIQLNSSGKCIVNGGEIHTNSNGRAIYVNSDDAEVVVNGGLVGVYVTVNGSNRSESIQGYAIYNAADCQKINVKSGKVGRVYNEKSGKITFGVQGSENIPIVQEIENASDGIIEIKNIKSYNGDEYFIINNKGTVNINDASVAQSYRYALIKNKQGTVNFKGGNIENTYFGDYSGYGISNGDEYGVNQKAVLNVENGTIIAKRTAILSWMNSKDYIPEVYIKSGTIKSTSTSGQNDNCGIRNYGILTVGTNDGTIDNNLINISSLNGAGRAIQNVQSSDYTGEFKLYEGTISGPIDKVIYGIIADMPENTDLTYTKDETTETVTVGATKAYKVGNKEYDCLRKAIEACKSGINSTDTIVLLKSTGIGGENLTITETQNIKFDLNGNKIYVHNSIENKGKFEIVDSSEERTGYIEVTDRLVTNDGEFTLSSGYINQLAYIGTSGYNSSNTGNRKIILNRGDGKVTINGGTVYSRVIGTGTSTIIYNESSNEVTLKGGNLTVHGWYYSWSSSTGNVVYDKYAGECARNIVLDGTTMVAVGSGTKNAIYIDNSNSNLSIKVKSGKIGSGFSNGIYSSGKVSAIDITGGEVLSSISVSNRNNEGNFTMSGGTISGGSINYMDNYIINGGNIKENLSVSSDKNRESTTFTYNDGLAEGTITIGEIKIANINGGTINNLVFNNKVTVGTIKNTNITGKLTISAGDISMISGEINNSNGHGIELSGGTFTLGVKEYPVYQNAPSVTGSKYGMYRTGGTFNFYDGIITGNENAAIYGTVGDKPELYSVVTSDDGKVAQLGIIATFAEVCEMDNIKYNSVQNAINTAENNKLTITMTADVVIAEKIVVKSGQNITIDLNSHSIKTATMDDCVIEIESGATLTIIDNDITSADESNDNYIPSAIENLAGVAIKNNGTLIIGVDDSTVFTKSPYISGITNAIANGSGATYNKYDGIVENKTIDTEND